MRAIAAGLRMPELTALAVRDIVDRAVSDHDASDRDGRRR